MQGKMAALDGRRFPPPSRSCHAHAWPSPTHHAALHQEPILAHALAALRLQCVRWDCIAPKMDRRGCHAVTRGTAAARGAPRARAARTSMRFCSAFEKGFGGGTSTCPAADCSQERRWAKRDRGGGARFRQQARTRGCTTASHAGHAPFFMHTVDCAKSCARATMKPCGHWHP